MPSVVPPGPLLRLLVPVLLVLGLVGMHGLVGGPSGGGHDSMASSAVAPAPGAHTGEGVAGHAGHVDPAGGTTPDGHVHLLELCLAVLGGLLAAVLVRAVVGLIGGTPSPAGRTPLPGGVPRRAPDLLALQVCRT